MESPTKYPSVASQASGDESFLEKQILWIIIIGSAVLCLICFIIICLALKTRKLYAMKKKRESAKTMKTHVNICMMPATSNSNNEEDNETYTHNVQRSTSVMIKTYLKSQQIEPVGNDNDAFNMSMKTQPHSQPHTFTSDITMSDLIQEMDTPQGNELMDQNQQNETFRSETVDAPIDELHEHNVETVEEKSMIPKPPKNSNKKTKFKKKYEKISLQNKENNESNGVICKSVFDRGLDNVIDTNDTLIDGVVNDMENDRLGVYGFNKDKQRHHISVEAFMPPSPDHAFPEMTMSFNTKLHSDGHSQNLLMQDIVADIANKENTFSSQ